MPRYRYLCTQCGCEQTIFHLFDEEPVLQCKDCCVVNSLERTLTVPLYIKGSPDFSKGKVGEIVEEHIEANREILVQQKQEAKEEEHEPS